MTSAEPIEVDIRVLGPLKKIGAGGQGTVYELIDGPNTLVYKEYSPRVVDDVGVAALQNFVRFQRELDEPLAQQLMARVAWPLNVIRRDGVVQGFVMPRVPVEFTVELVWATGRSPVLAQVQYLLNGEDYLRDRGLLIDDTFRLEFLHDVAAILALLHSVGITVGDLSPNNLLFSLTSRPRCFFIDCDAMRLGTDSVLEQTETPDWRVADIGTEELATPASDSYKLGLLALRLFARDQHTRDPAAAAQLPRRIRRLVTASLDGDPRSRPAPESWLLPLQASIREAAAKSTRSVNGAARFERPSPSSGPFPPWMRSRLAALRPATARAQQFAAAGVALVISVVLFGSLGSEGGAQPTPSAPYTQPAYPTDAWRYTPLPTSYTLPPDINRYLTPIPRVTLPPLYTRIPLTAVPRR